MKTSIFKIFSVFAKIPAALGAVGESFLLDSLAALRVLRAAFLSNRLRSVFQTPSSNL